MELDFYRDFFEVVKKLYFFLMEKDELWCIIKLIFGSCYSFVKFYSMRGISEDWSKWFLIIWF